MARRIKNWRNLLTFKNIFTVSAVIGFVVLLFFAFLWIDIPRKTKAPIKKGVTFSVPYAKELGINWREALGAILDDLGIRYFRIPVYWSLVEPEEDAYDWSDIDFQLNEIAERDGHVILAIGAKLPRWPECWIPDWALHKGVQGEREARLDYIRKAVERYKDHHALEAWQVENEALFQFGICPKPSRAFLKQEIELVRKLDIAHPITTTDSGELSTWIRVGSLVDRLGISTYRVVRTFWGAAWHYTFIPPYWYAKRALLVKSIGKNVYVSEFQMEPWVDDSVTETPLQRQFETFNIEQMGRNFEYAERMRFDEIYFWGVEWWWWMKVRQRDDRFWNEAKAFFLSD